MSPGVRLLGLIWAGLAGLVGCGGSAATPKPPQVTLSQLHDGAALTRAQLAERAQRPAGILKQELSIGIRDLVSGRGFEGRGVVMVKPREALRMILLGPGGTTAMDVWIADGKFRVAIPALDRIMRGDASTPRDAMRGLPVDLLWRWLVDPFGGTFVHARTEGQGFLAFLKRGPTSFEIRRRTPEGAEGWFFEKGKLIGVAHGREERIGDALFPVDVDYVGLDPAMKVHVQGTGATVVTEVSPRVFADPDG